MENYGIKERLELEQVGTEKRVRSSSFPKNQKPPPLRGAVFIEKRSGGWLALMANLYKLLQIKKRGAVLPGQYHHPR